MFAAFYAAVQEPFMSLANSYGSALLIAFITPFLWFFGLHGANMIDPFMQAINAPAIEANANALAAGKAAPYIVNKPFIDSFVNMGGTGVTIGLIIAIYLVGRKNKPFMVVNNLAAAPGIFNINEPLMFGLPLVLNPIMFIPFILTPMVCVTTAYFATKFGLVPPATVMPPWVTPPIIGGFLATQSFSGAILAAVNLVISIAMYVPFVSLATRQELKKVKEAEA
jgi:PTS system cellobiose-specific IIC component